MAIMPTPAQNLKGAEGPIAKASEGEAVVCEPTVEPKSGTQGMAVMPTPAQNLKEAEGPIAKASEGEAVVYLPRTIGNTGYGRHANPGPKPDRG
jgi:hypothetical protein